MWCSQGYIHWGEFIWLCRRAAKLRWPTPDGYTAPVLENGELDWRNDNRTKAVLTSIWLRQSGIQGISPRVSLCSPKGQTFAISSYFFEVTPVMPSHEGNPSLGIGNLNLLSDDPNEHRLFLRHFNQSVVTHLDSYSGQILRPALSFFVSLQLKLFFGRLRRRNVHAVSAEIVRWRIARRFAGWAICFEKCDLLSSPQAMLDGFTKFWLELDDPCPDPSHIGAGLEHAYLCFRNAFPNGKGKATWPDVEAKTGYSRRHIIRAIGEFSGQTVGQDGGQSSI